MPSAYSILHNYDQPLYSPDFNLIQQGLAFKQQKLDVNRAKVQTLYDQMDALQVAKGVDQEYIDNRLQQIRDTTNQYASRDLSDDTFTNSLLSNMSQLVDDRVKNAVYSTRVMEFEDKQWEKIRIEKPERYAELNHEYALSRSDRNRYLNSQEAGDKYQGGAGFIEYTDVNKKIMENIPKIAEQLKAKWVETGPQQGYFQSLDTYEAVDKNKLSQALDTILDPKDRQQLQINGWGTYRGTPDNVLKQEYDSYFSPQLEEAEKNIRNIEILKADPKWRGKEAQLNEELASWTKRKQDIQNFSFENMYQTYGREAVGQTLFNAKFKDGILNTFAYGPRLIDREIDQVQKASVEFGQRLAEYEQKVMRDERDYQLDVAKFEYQMRKDAGTLQGTETRTLGGRSQLDTDEGATLKNEIQTLNAGEDNAIRDLNNLLGGYKVSAGDYKDLAIQLKNIGDIYSAGGSVKIGGKEVKLNKENLQTFINFKENVLEESESERAIRRKTENAVEYLTNNLRRSTQAYYAGRAADMNPQELPNFRWKFEIDPKTKKPVKVQIAPGDKGHYYARLLNIPKEKLTQAQKLTLKAYATYHVIGDDELGFSPELRDKMFKNLQSSLMTSGMSPKNVKSLAQSRQDVEKGLGFKGGLGGGVDVKEYSTNFSNKLVDLGIVSGYTPSKTSGNRATLAVPEKYVADVEKLADLYRDYTGNPRNQQTIRSIRNLEEKLRNNTRFATPKTLGQDYYLSELTGGDLEYVDSSGRTRRSRSSTGIVKNALTGIQTDLDNLSKQLNLPSQYNLFVSEKDPSYRRLKNILMQEGKVGDNFKGQIEIQPFIKNGAYTGDAALIVKKTATTKGVEVVTPEVAGISLDVLEQSGIRLQEMKRPVYSAEYGEDSKPIHIGQGRAAENKRNPLLLNVNNIRQEALQYNALPQVNNILATYYAKGYLFSIEPIDGQYYKVGRDKQGNVLAKIPTGEIEFDTEDVTSIYDNSETIGSEIVQEIINNELRKADILGQ